MDAIVIASLIGLGLVAYVGIGLLFDWNWRSSDISNLEMIRNITTWPVMIALFHRNKVSDLIEKIKHND